MVVINPTMNMAEKLIFLGQGLQNISMTSVGAIETVIRYPELIIMMNYIERIAAESCEENIVQAIRLLNEEVRIILQRSCTSIVNNVIDLYYRVIQ